MAHQLNFEHIYHYQTSKGGITIPVALMAGDRTVDCEAKVDTGAEYCLFERKYADRLGLDLETGHPLRLGTLSGSLVAYGHELTLETVGLVFEVTVYFAEDYRVARSLLGRNGWLRRLGIGLNDYDETLYLSAYADAVKH